MTDTTTATIEVLGVERTSGAGKLIGLSVIRLELDGVEMTLQGVQVMRTPAGLTVRAPMFRHPRDGRWLPAVLLPEDLRDAIGAEVLAAMGGG